MIIWGVSEKKVLLRKGYCNLPKFLQSNLKISKFLHNFQQLFITTSTKHYYNFLPLSHIKKTIKVDKRKRKSTMTNKNIRASFERTEEIGEKRALPRKPCMCDVSEGTFNWVSMLLMKIGDVATSTPLHEPGGPLPCLKARRRISSERSKSISFGPSRPIGSSEDSLYERKKFHHKLFYTIKF